MKNGSAQGYKQFGSPSFTLLELLIVIAVLAILAAVTVVVLNPAELMQRTRDGRRINELSSIHRALGYFRATAPVASLGLPQRVYVSLPDTSPTCASHALPPLPTGWTYQCATTANFRNINGTGWIPVDFTTPGVAAGFAALPIDPINNATHFYTYITGGSWVLRALLESQRTIQQASTDGGSSDAAFELGTNLQLGAGVFPGGWARLPNGTFVMQWEAKYDRDGDGTGDVAAAAGCPADAGLGLDWRDAGCNTPANIVSTAVGAPIVHISHDQARAACTAIGARLINNHEWMAIARDAEQVPANWSGGAVGSGCVFRGNDGWNTACGYDGADPGHGFIRDRRAWLMLSNGTRVFDFAGNVTELVMRDEANTLIHNTPTDGGATGWRWIEHTAIVGYGDLSYETVRPSNPAWNFAHGMGRIFTNNGPAANRIMTRGGNWGSGENAGAFMMSLQWDTATQWQTVGFRCAR